MLKLGVEALPRSLKKIIKSFIPSKIVINRRNKILDSFSGLSNQEIFTAIYRNYLWGRKNGDFGFYSGDGSHDPVVVDDYVISVTEFLTKFDLPPVVVDLGCGDFHIGSLLAQYCSEYVACDVVPELIESNIRRNNLINVKFKVLDAVTQELPSGDVVIIRQMLQHLSNHDVKEVLKGIEGRFRYLIFTDHQPLKSNWIPNLDIITGHTIRVEINSGLDLNLQPFNLGALECNLISEVKVDDGIIRTYIFRLL